MQTTTCLCQYLHCAHMRHSCKMHTCRLHICGTLLWQYPHCAYMQHSCSLLDSNDFDIGLQKVKVIFTEISKNLYRMNEVTQHKSHSLKKILELLQCAIYWPPPTCFSCIDSKYCCTKIGNIDKNAIFIYRLTVHFMCFQMILEL